ncbi:diguanylate cyclase [Hydrogenimonas sp.]|uniref:diguanylate cyclase domain-containing protein n=1 Tax=Hydrogenimonas sp. TaxID=2231112 RepID=UPI0026097637|nr:diguanylate cyclase [Hydrogenimonas sp.]
MHNELFLKRFKLFRALAIAAEQEKSFDWCKEFGDHCTHCSYDEVERYDFTQPPHLVMLQYSGETVYADQLDRIMKRLQSLGYWQLLVFAGEEDEESAKDFAIEHHAFGVYPTPHSHEDAMKSIVAGLPSLLERLQEQTRIAQLQKIVDMAPPEIVMGGRGQVLFINESAKRVFDVADAKMFEEELLESLALERVSCEEGAVTVLPFRDDKLLVTCSGHSDKERLFTFLKLPSDLDMEQRQYVSRIEFIDALKDRMAQRFDMEDPLAVMLVRLSNFETIIDSFGWMTAHTVLKEFGTALTTHFAPVDCFGIWHKDMPVAIFEKRPSKELQELLDTFIAELKLLEFGQNITLSAEFILIDVRDEDLNALIGLIENAYEGTLSVSDTRGFSLYKTGTNHESPDEEQLLQQFFTNIMANRLPIKLLNIYKGLPISTPTKILKMEEERIIVKAEKIQKFVMDIEKRVVLQSPHLPGDIEAEVHFTDAQRPLAILKKPKMMHSSINNRKHTRVNVTSRLPILIKLGRSHYTGFINDISINSIAVYFNSDKFAENELKEKRVNVSFRLPWENEEGFVNIVVGAHILFNRNENGVHKVVLILEPDDVSESYMFDYIYKRQKELIKEIKSKIG